jgi:hypothetical protein
MSILHPFADKETIDYVEASLELKKLLTELNHRYGVIGCKLGSDKAISLIWPNFVFAGLAYTRIEINENTNERRTVYCIESTIVAKERGRGNKRYIRKSEKISSLMKIIDSAFKARHKQIAESRGLKVLGARNSVENMLDSKVSKLKHNTHLSGVEEYDLFKNILMGEPMPQHLLEKIAESLTKHKQREKENLEREKLLKKFDHIHILWGSTTTPICYGVARLVDKDYMVQGEVKPCFDERDLPDDFAVHLKMHKISREQMFKDYAADGFTPMHQSLLRRDAFDEDFETVTYYGVSEAHQGMKYIYVTPVQSTDAN